MTARQFRSTNFKREHHGRVRSFGTIPCQQVWHTPSIVNHWRIDKWTTDYDFARAIEAKVTEQFKGQRVGYLLGAGSSYLDNAGYPLAFELWDLVKSKIADPQVRADIQAKLDTGASGLEHALDLLDDGGANDTPYRHMVTEAIANLFLPKTPNLDLHVKFVQRLSQRADPSVKVFSLNYDPLVERGAEVARVRILDGFLGMEHAYFAPEVFVERTGQIRGSHNSPVMKSLSDQSVSGCDDDDEYCWFAFDVRHDGDRQGSIELNNEQNGALCARSLPRRA